MTSFRERAQRAMDAKTKPPGSLGGLEDWAVDLAVLKQSLCPRLGRMRVLVFAADHGVSVEGVSAYPREVTPQMTLNFARGGAAINVLAASAGIDVEAIDVGVDGELGEVENLVHARVRRGSRNFLQEPALAPQELEAALAVGRDAVNRASRDGVGAVGLGEMGIGNTTSAAALLSALTGLDPSETVGRGTGVRGEALDHKRGVVRRALELHREASGVHEQLAALGGLEIAAMVGATLEAARQGVAVMVDGFISTVAALVACRLDPEVRPALFFAHRSAEQGHEHALRALDARPLLDLGMRLGEGSGAALALPVLRAAADLLCDMATFESAGVSNRDDPPSHPGSP